MHENSHPSALIKQIQVQTDMFPFIIGLTPGVLLTAIYTSSVLQLCIALIDFTLNLLVSEIFKIIKDF